MTTVKDVYSTWLTRQASDETVKSYEITAKEFAELMFNKTVEELDVNDFKKISPHSVTENYEKKLREKGLKNSTIKYRLGVVSQFVRKIQINQVFDDVNYGLILDEALSDKHIKSDTEHTRPMTIKDKEEFREWLEKSRYSKRYAHKGKLASLLVETLFVTGARLSATFNIKLQDIVLEEDSFGNKTYVIHTFDKREKHNRSPVTDEFYNYLIDVVGDIPEDVPIFIELSQRNFTNDIKHFAELKGIRDSFTPHSLRSLAITQVYETTKDIVKAKDFANHESIETTVNYIQRQNNLVDSGSYLLSSKPVTVDDIAHLTKEQLLMIVGQRQDIMQYIKRESE